jgi:hypothetical protein
MTILFQADELFNPRLMNDETSIVEGLHGPLSQ